MFDPVFERAACRLRRLLQAFARAVKFPSVIRTTNPLVIDSPIRQGSQPMRAMFADQSVLPLLVAINHQFFPENLDRFDGFFLGKLTGGGNRVPVAPQQLPAGRTATRRELIARSLPASASYIHFNSSGVRATSAPWNLYLSLFLSNICS